MVCGLGDALSSRSPTSPRDRDATRQPVPLNGYKDHSRKLGFAINGYKRVEDIAADNWVITFEIVLSFISEWYLTSNVT